MSRLPGVKWIVGMPQCGKTTLARGLAAHLRSERGWPVLVLDSQEVHNFEDVPLNTIDEAVEALWTNPRGSARVVPEGIEHVDRICRAVRAGKRVVMVVDEAHFWLSSQSGASSELLRVMRATQHAQADLLLTSQHLTGDVPQSALSCTSELIVFRCTSPRVLQVLDREFGMDRRQVANLGQFQFIRNRIGF